MHAVDWTMVVFEADAWDVDVCLWQSWLGDASSHVVVVIKCRSGVIEPPKLRCSHAWILRLLHKEPVISRLVLPALPTFLLVRDFHL